MIEYIAQLYWHDIRYYISVPLLIGIGHFIGWMRHKEKCARDERKERIAITGTIGKPVYLEDMGKNYDEQG